MRRKLFAFASALSLLLCIATAVLWVRSYWHKDAYVLHWRMQLWEVASDKGRVVVDNAPQIKMEVRSRPARARAVFEQWKRLTDLGHRLENNGDDNGARAAFKQADNELLAVRQVLTGPTTALVTHSALFEFPVVLTATLPLLWFRSWRRSCWWRRHGFCSRCGYDLRATPGRCPECGHVPERAKATA